MIEKYVVDPRSEGTSTSSMLGVFSNQIWALIEKLNVFIHRIKHVINFPTHILAGNSISNYVSNI